MNVRGVVAIVSLSLCVAVAHAQTAYDTLVKQGNAQLQAGNATSALASGQKAIAADPARWEAYTVTGGALMNLKRYDEAIDNLSKAIDHAPEAKQAALRDLRKQCFQAESGMPPPPAMPATPAPAPTPQTAPATQAEIVLWKTIESSTNPADFQTYLNQYPHGAYGALAQRHLDETINASIDCKDADACLQMALANDKQADPDSKARAVLAFRKSCALGSPTACRIEGILYINGSNGLAQDKAQGLDFLRKGCDPALADRMSQKQTIFGVEWKTGWDVPVTGGFGMEQVCETLATTGTPEDAARAATVAKKGCDFKSSENCALLAVCT